MLRQSKSQFRWGGILFASLFAVASLVSTGYTSEFRYPRPPNYGRVVPKLPPRHGSVMFGREKYFHHGGVFYRHRQNGYVIVGPPIGVVIAPLPVGFRVVVVGNDTYYYSGGVYYRKVPSGYMVIEPPSEVVVVQPPPPVTQPSAKSGDRVTVTAQRLNARSGPGINFSVIQIFNQGEVLEILGNAPGWLYVKFSEGFGWVQEAYTSPVSVPPNG
ncbi:MAG: DUF6515 family protein [Pseudomonadota bacterium]